MTQLQINGQARNIDVPDDTPLLWVLRDELGLTGTKFGCGVAICGACTAFVDGQPVRTCVTPAAYAAGRNITTIENIDADPVGKAVQQAWVENNVAQCGYCQAGQIMSAVSLLKSTPSPSDDEIRTAMNANICRCGTYPRIHKAIRQAADTLVKGA